MSKNKYVGPTALSKLIKLINIEIRKVVIGILTSELTVDDEGNLIYNEHGTYNFKIGSDGNLEWRDNNNG